MPWCFRAPSKPFVPVITWLLIIYQLLYQYLFQIILDLSRGIFVVSSVCFKGFSEWVKQCTQSPSGTSSAIGSWSEGACIRNRLCQLLPYGTDLILPLRSLATIFLFQDQQAWTPAWFATTFWRSWSSRHMSSAKDILESVSALLHTGHTREANWR